MQDDFPIALHPPGLFLSSPGHHLKQLYNPPAPGDKQNGFWSRWKAWGQSWQEPSILQERRCEELNSSANGKSGNRKIPKTIHFNSPAGILQKELLSESEYKQVMCVWKPLHTRGKRREKGPL